LWIIDPHLTAAATILIGLFGSLSVGRAANGWMSARSKRALQPPRWPLVDALQRDLDTGGERNALERAQRLPGSSARVRDRGRECGPNGVSPATVPASSGRGRCPPITTCVAVRSCTAMSPK